MKKILVPVDFSAISARAVRAAEGLAQKAGAEVHLLYVINSAVVCDETGNDAIVQAECDACLLMQEFIRDFDLHPANNQVKMGNLVEEVNHYTERAQIDLVLMGTKGAEGLRELFVGSNAEKIVRESKVPVLFVKAHSPCIDVKSLAIAASFDKEPPKDIRLVLDMYRLFKPQVHLVEVCVPENMWMKEAILRAMETFAAKHGLENPKFHILESFSVSRGLELFTECQKVDLLAMGTHQRTGINRLFKSSIAETVVNHLPETVLTFRLEKEEAVS